MTPKIKNILIFTTIAVVLILIYVFFINRPSEESSLVSSPASGALPNMDGTPLPAGASTDTLEAAEDIIALLSNVGNITIDVSIFSDPSFISLNDSTYPLFPDNNEGRPNPFAQFGNDATAVVPPTCTPPQVLDTNTNTCVAPAAVTCTSPQVLDAVTNTCVSEAAN